MRQWFETAAHFENNLLLDLGSVEPLRTTDSLENVTRPGEGEEQNMLNYFIYLYSALCEDDVFPRKGLGWRFTNNYSDSILQISHLRHCEENVHRSLYPHCQDLCTHIYIKV
jgi:hypothetical protein